MKAILKVFSVRNTLGKNFSNLKTLTKKWLSELLPRFHFLLSYWQPAYSYGQTSSRQTPHNWQIQGIKSVAQVWQDSHNASLKKTPTKSREVEATYIQKEGIFSSFVNSFNIESFKVRVLNGLYTFWENKRLRWGMLFLLIIAPASKFFYMILPEGGFGEYFIEFGPIKIANTIEGVKTEGGWYFAFFYQYFFSIGELLAPVFSIFGIFLLFPKKYYPSYLVGVPFGYYLSMLIHRMFFVVDQDSFHGGFTSTMTFTFLLLGVVFFMVSDKVLFKENHRKRASEARIIGLINMPGMSWDEKEHIIKKEVAEVMKVDNELFIKETA